MKNPYTGEALKTFERLHVLISYYNNKLYVSPDNVLYYVNKRGYLHAYTAGKCKNYDGSKIYCIRDNLLTRDNMLQESLTTFYQTKEEARDAWQAMQAEARANTAQETATESQREPEAVAAEEEPTEAEKDAQRATERPQKPATDQEKKNRIPRNAKKIYITWLIDTSSTKAGDHDTVEKTERGWIGTTATGTNYFMFVSLLRNGHAVQIDRIETQETATEPAGDQEKTTGDKDSTRSDKASQSATEDAPTVSETQSPATHAPATQEATTCDTMRQYAERTTMPRSGAHAPATDQETQRPAKDQEHPQTTASQTTEASQSTHKPATSPTEARNDRRRANYHHSRKTATQSHRESARHRARTTLPAPATIRSTGRTLPQGTQEATGRTETAQAIHAPPCHPKASRKPRREARQGKHEHTCDQSPCFFPKAHDPRPILAKNSSVPTF